MHVPRTQPQINPLGLNVSGAKCRAHSYIPLSAQPLLLNVKVMLCQVREVVRAPRTTPLKQSFADKSTFRIQTLSIFFTECRRRYANACTIDKTQNKTRRVFFLCAQRRQPLRSHSPCCECTHISYAAKLRLA